MSLSSNEPASVSITVIGDVVHVSALGRHLIILNSHEAAIELLEKRSSIYSERPILPMAGEMSVPSLIREKATIDDLSLGVVSIVESYFHPASETLDFASSASRYVISWDLALRPTFGISSNI